MRKFINIYSHSSNYLKKLNFKQRSIKLLEVRRFVMDLPILKTTIFQLLNYTEDIEEIIYYEQLETLSYWVLEYCAAVNHMMHWITCNKSHGKQFFDILKAGICQKYQDF